MISLKMLMTLQQIAGVISLIGALLVVFVVVIVLISSEESEDKTTAKKKVYKARSRYLWGLCIVVLVMLFVSLRTLPYTPFHKKADETVTVVGHQWSWKMEHGVSTVKPEDFEGSNEITVPVNKNIEFIVTSKDVNHNFAIYDSQGVLLAQTQAMPGYNNNLQYKFEKKGEYKILCLEYCGTAHDFMMGAIHVN